MKKQSTIKRQAPDYVKDLGKPPEPIDYGLYDKIIMLVQMKLHPSLKNVSDVGWWLRNNKDTLKASIDRGALKIKELSVISRMFNFPIEGFFSPLTPLEYLMKHREGGDVASLSEKNDELMEKLSSKEQELAVRMKDIRKLKQEITFLKKQE